MTEQEILRSQALIVLEAPPQLLDDSSDLVYYFTSFLRANEHTKGTNCRVLGATLNKDNLAAYLQSKEAPPEKSAGAASVVANDAVKELAVVRFSGSTAVMAVSEMLEVTLQGSVHGLELRRGYLRFKHQTLLLECVLRHENSNNDSSESQQLLSSAEPPVRAAALPPSPVFRLPTSPQPPQTQTRSSTSSSANPSGRASDIHKRSPDANSAPSQPMSLADPTAVDYQQSEPQESKKGQPTEPADASDDVPIACPYAEMPVVVVVSFKVLRPTPSFRLTPTMVLEIFRSERRVPVCIALLSDGGADRPAATQRALVEMPTARDAGLVIQYFSGTLVELCVRPPRRHGHSRGGDKGESDTRVDVAVRVTAEYSPPHNPNSPAYKGRPHLDFTKNDVLRDPRHLLIMDPDAKELVMPLGERAWSVGERGGNDGGDRKRRRSSRSRSAERSERRQRRDRHSGDTRDSTSTQPVQLSAMPPYSAQVQPTVVSSYPQPPGVANPYYFLPSRQAPQHQHYQQPYSAAYTAAAGTPYAASVAAPIPQPLPPGWRSIYSEEYGRDYYAYLDPRTGKETTTWERPT